MDALPEMNARLRRISRGEDRFGEGIPAEQARRFRLEVLLPAAIIQAKRNSAEVRTGPVDLLVSLSGFSPETTVMAFHLVQPKRLMIVGSEETRASADVIQQKLGLPLSRLDVRYVNPIDPMKIYQLIQEAAHLTASNGSRLKILIDITGGKKVMSASAALAASQLDLPLCYIDSTFDAELRQSEPGTERLVTVRNPTALFGDREMEGALIAFRHGAYGAAHDRFKDVAENAFEPARARFLRDLANVYQSWCDLDFVVLKKKVHTMGKHLGEPAYRVPATTAKQIRAQLDFLSSLIDVASDKRENPSMLLNFYLLGQHYSRLGRFDFAALLYYRTIESCFAQRLMTIAPGFRASAPDYRLFHLDPLELLERYQALHRAVHGEDVGMLPAQVDLMKGALLLAALGDQLLIRLDMATEKGLKHLKGRLLARNSSVLAHGTEPIAEQLSMELGRTALRGTREVWALSGEKQKVDDRLAELSFVVAP